MIKEFLKECLSKKLFKTIHFEIFLTDGSVQKTDPISYKKFKELVDLKVSGEELRTARQEDYEEAYKQMLLFVEKPHLSDYFSVSIRDKTVEFSSRDIIKVKMHKKG